MPERSLRVQIFLALLPDQRKRNELRKEPPGSRNQHRTRWKINWRRHAHGSHRDDNNRHGQQEAAIHKGADDFGARPAKAPLFIRRTQRHTRRDNGDQHTAHGRKGMERVGDDRD